MGHSTSENGNILFYQAKRTDVWQMVRVETDIYEVETIEQRHYGAKSLQNELHHWSVRYFVGFCLVAFISGASFIVEDWPNAVPGHCSICSRIDRYCSSRCSFIIFASSSKLVDIVRVHFLCACKLRYILIVLHSMVVFVILPQRFVVVSLFSLHLIQAGRARQWSYCSRCCNISIRYVHIWCRCICAG